MSASAENNITGKQGVSKRLVFAPGERPLYFNNHGLFSDPFLTHHLPDLETKGTSDAGSKYLNKYWNAPAYEGVENFNHVYSQILSLWDQYGDLLPTYNEAQLEERWIKPILKLLGWTYEVQDGKTKRAKRNIPDYSLFESEAGYLNAKKTKTDEAYFKHVLAVADAKAWRLSLDGTGTTASNPAYQITRYMEHAGVPWSILTNGRFWRLYSTRSNSKHTTFYEINLESLLVKRDDAQFRFFYNFFRKDAFVRGSASNQCFLDVVFEQGVYYAKDIEENLKKRVFEVVESIAKGFVGNANTLSDTQLRQAYEHSLYYLFRLMFVLNCESKGLLAVDRTSDYYEYSLRKLITGLKEQFDGSQNWSAQNRTYALINDLFDLLAKGDQRIGVFGFGEEVFASGDKKFYETHKIPDHYLNSALVQLACDYSKDGFDLQFIDYKRLSEDHLGSLFEGLLEYELKYADRKMAIRKTGKVVDWTDLTQVQRGGLETINIGQLYLSSGSGERKATGSYYTPQYIVDAMVESALHDLTADKTPKDFLALRVCDPAMGSGHFLLGAVKYLEERVQAFIYTHETEAPFEIEAIRWQILANCVYGVDFNPLAVELSKFSLWMYTARRGFKLEPLSDQLKVGDSLVEHFSSYEKNFDWKKEFFESKGFDGFHAIIGNPPWDTVKPKLTDFYKAYTGSSKSLKRKELDDWINAKTNAKARAAYEKYESEKLRYADYLKTDAGYEHQEGESQTHSLFTERAMQLLVEGGSLAFVTKLGFYSDKFQTSMRKFLYLENRVRSMRIFQKNNLPEGIVFEGVDPNEKFLLIDVVKGKPKSYSLSAKFVTRRADIKSTYESWMTYDVPGDLDPELAFLEVFETKEKASLISVLKKHPSVKQLGLEIFRELDATMDRNLVTESRTDIPVFVGESIGHFKLGKPGLFGKVKTTSDFPNFGDRKIGVRNILPNSRRKIYAAVLPGGSLCQNSVLCIKIKGAKIPYQYLLAFLNCYVQEYFIRPKLSNLNLNNFRLEMFRIPAFENNRYANEIVDLVAKIEKKSGFDFDRDSSAISLEALTLASFGFRSGDKVLRTMYKSFGCSESFCDAVLEQMSEYEGVKRKAA